MNSENFEKWLTERLLPGLQNPSIIVLDNAKYHSRVEEKQPTRSWTKEKIQIWLKTKNIDFSDTAFKAELLQIAGADRTEEHYVVDNLIREHGHEVLRLPPYHCQFNPIELVWGICKEYYDKHIGKDGFSDEAVLAMWNEALSQVSSSIWSNCVNHTNKLILETYDREVHTKEVMPLIISVNSNDEDSEELDTDEEN